MTDVVVLLGVVVAVVGLVGAVSPAMLRDFASWFRTSARIYGGLVFRLATGVFLILAASNCRLEMQWVVRAIGILAIVVALSFLFLGTRRLKSFIEWWLSLSVGYFRLAAVLALLLGSALIYAGTGG